MAGEFDKTLDGYKEQIDQTIRSIIDGTSYPDEFKEVLSYSLFPGGKRLRPVLMLAVHDMFSAPDEYALNYACGLEILHSYSLIHDDMPCMDNDMVRRGKPSVHAAYGEGKALLAGDALMDIAYRLLGAPTPTGGTSPFWALSSKCGDDGLICGQYYDLYGKIDTRDKLLNMYERKTGALLILSCLSGYVLGNNLDYATVCEYKDTYIFGVDPCKYYHAVEIFGSCFGAAFQLYDDISEYINGEKSDGTTILDYADLDEAKRLLYGMLNNAARALDGIKGKNTDFLRTLLNKFVIL